VSPINSYKFGFPHRLQAPQLESHAASRHAWRTQKKPAAEATGFLFYMRKFAYSTENDISSTGKVWPVLTAPGDSAVGGYQTKLS